LSRCLKEKRHLNLESWEGGKKNGPKVSALKSSPGHHAPSKGGVSLKGPGEKTLSKKKRTTAKKKKKGGTLPSGPENKPGEKGKGIEGVRTPPVKKEKSPKGTREIHPDGRKRKKSKGRQKKRTRTKRVGEIIRRGRKVFRC